MELEEFLRDDPPTYGPASDLTTGTPYTPESSTSDSYTYTDGHRGDSSWFGGLSPRPGSRTPHKPMPRPEPRTPHKPMPRPDMKRGEMGKRPDAKPGDIAKRPNTKSGEKPKRPEAKPGDAPKRPSKA